MMTWPVAIALLSFSAPTTAALIAFFRKPSSSGVSRSEFVQFEKRINDRFDTLQTDVRELRRFVHDRF